MKILYLAHSMTTGGVQKCVLQLTKYLKDDYGIIVASAYGELVKELNDMNIKHYKINDTDNKSLYNILMNILRIAKIVRKENIDIIHSHHRMTTFYAKIVAKILNVKIVHTQHLCIDDKYKMTSKVLKGIPVITVSNGAKEILIEKCGLDKDKITTIYNTIDEECKDKTTNKILTALKKENKFIVGQINRLVEYKGVYDFLMAAKIVLENKKNQNISFVIIGEGPEKDNMIKFVDENKLNDNIYILGKISNVIYQMQFIDLIVLSSYIEGLPLVPLEAFSQGIPVIGTNIPGTNEEIVNGFNGYLVEKGNYNEIAEKIVKLYSDRNQLEEMKVNSKEVFENYFNKSNYIKKHLELYCNI